MPNLPGDRLTNNGRGRVPPREDNEFDFIETVPQDYPTGLIRTRADAYGWYYGWSFTDGSPEFLGPFESIAGAKRAIRDRYLQSLPPGQRPQS